MPTVRERRNSGTASKGEIKSSEPTMTIRQKRRGRENKQYSEAMQSSRKMEIETTKQSESKNGQEKKKPQDTLYNTVYGGTNKFLAPENKQNIKETVKQYEILDTAKKRLMSKGPVGDALVERPSYGQRVKDTLGELPKALRPLVAPVVALSEAPFMLGTREALGSEDSAREGFLPVSGGGKIAGQILAPLHHLAGAQGAGLAGGQLYSEAGNLLSRYAPSLANTVGGRVAGKVIQGVSEGIPTNVGATLAANPQATPQELKESALYGAGFGLIPGAGKAIGEGLQASVRKSLSPYVKGLQDRILAGNALRKVAEGTPSKRPTAPTSELTTPPYENPNELAKWVKREAGFDDISLNEMRKLGYEDLRQLADDIVKSRTSKATEPIAEAVATSQTVRQRRGAKPANTAKPQQAAQEAAATAEPAPLRSDVQGYAGNSIPFRQGAQQNQRTISRTKVIKNMRKNLDVVIDTGRLNAKKNVLGIFKIKPEVIRSRQAEDIQVLSHEIGHNLDKRHGLADPQYQNELVNMVNTVSPNHLANYQPQQHMDEAIAEYVRLRLVDPQQARQLAPNFTRHFDAKIGPKTLKGLEASQQDVDTWITQGDYEQAKGLIDFDNAPKEKPSFDKWYTDFVDDLNPLKLAERALKGKVGLGNDSVYKMARLSRGVAEKAKLAITRGIYDAQGNKLVEGLSQMVKPLEKLGVKEKDFAAYMSILHAIDLKKLGKQVPFDDKQIKAVMNRLDSPELRAVQKNVVKWNNALMDILVDAQVLHATTVMQMRRQYPNYVPFMRYFDDDAIAGFKNGGYGAAKGFANITNPIKRMSDEGSTRTIINPFESMVNNTFLVMNAAAKNKVGLQLAGLSKIDGAGALVEHVGEGAKVGKEHIIDVFEDGVRQQYKIREPELYNAMLSLDAESTNALVKFLGGAAGLLRAGATLTPEFIIRNPMRDVVGAMINSAKYGFNPVDFFKGLYHVMGRTKEFDQFLSSGGAMSTLMSLDRDANREALKAVFRKSLKDKTMNVVTSPKELAKMLTLYTPAKTVIGGLRKASEMTELATKVGLFNKTLKKTGSLDEAAYTARDIMDFNRAGSNIRQANRAVAFLNASIQGTDKMLRSFKENPAAFTVRAFTTLVLPSVGLYYWNKNLPPEMKKEYENIPQWQKDSFFIIGIPGMNEFIRIPKPFEAGVLFASGTERLMRHFEDNDPDAFKDYGRTAMEAFTPPVMLTALTPLLEAITNHSFFRKAPIVSQGDQRFEKKDQYGLYTSETAKGIGQLMSKTPLKNSNFASPKIIDNTIKGYTAGLGAYAVSGIDAAIKGIRGKSGPTLPQKKLTEQPLAKAFFVNTAGGGQVREDFYTKWSKASQKRASAMRTMGEDEEYKDPEYELLNAGKKIIDKLNKVYKEVQNHLTMSAAKKREKLDLLDEKMNEVAALTLGKK